MEQTEAERTGVLVVRVWKRVGNSLLRARLTGRRDVLGGPETSLTVTGAEGVAEAVRNWLDAFEVETDSGPESGDTSVTKA